MSCPVCGNNPNSPRSPEIENQLRTLFRRRGGLMGELCNPGGRALEFGDGTKIQLSDMCNVCDVNKLIEKLS